MEDLQNQPATNDGLYCPTWLKVSYTGFMAILVPYYLHAYGPSNFLWFCDVALIVTLIALWKKSRFLISTQAVAIVFPQLLWCLDFVYGLLTGGQIVGLAQYMFDPEIPLFVRGLSLFHGWMPIMLLWLVWRNGYHPTAWKTQSAICWGVLLTAFLLLGNPESNAGNVNKVFGWGDTAQTAMHPLAWLAIVMAAYPVAVYLPSHLVFKRVFRQDNRSPNQRLAQVAA